MNYCQPRLRWPPMAPTMRGQLSCSTYNSSWPTLFLFKSVAVLVLLQNAVLLSTGVHGYIVGSDNYWDYPSVQGSDYTDNGDGNNRNSNSNNNKPSSRYLSLGSFCEPNNDDCGDNLYCRKRTYCPGEWPICLCMPGFLEDPQSNTCLKLASIGEPCSSSGDTNFACADKNAFCNENGVCHCLPHYKVGPNGDDCVSTWKTQFFGQKCKNSIQCHYNMTCDEDIDICICEPGTRTDPATHSQCLINGLNDTCSSDEDCFLDNSVCNPPGVCVCDDGFVTLTLRLGSVDAPLQHVCVSNEVNATRRRRLGEHCGLTYPFDQGLCSSNLVCATCNNYSTAICVDPSDNRPRPTTLRPPSKIYTPMYGDSCSSPQDCSTKDKSLTCLRQSSICRPVGVTGGTCICADGFYLVSENKTCLKKPDPAYLSEQCVIYDRKRITDNCIVENSGCINGVCDCKLGFKLGPLGDDCVSNWKTQYLGDECYDSIQCYHNLVCSNGTCSCVGVGRPSLPIEDPLTGHSVVIECDIVQAGDPCTNNKECFGVHNAHCVPSARRCLCDFGFASVTVHIGSPDDYSQWCVPVGTQLRTEGEECTLQQPIQDRTSEPPKIVALCHPDFYCSKCDPSTIKNICLRRSDVPQRPARKLPTTTTIRSNSSALRTTTRRIGSSKSRPIAAYGRSSNRQRQLPDDDGSDENSITSSAVTTTTTTRQTSTALMKTTPATNITTAITITQFFHNFPLTSDFPLTTKKLSGQGDEFVFQAVAREANVLLNLKASAGRVASVISFGFLFCSLVTVVVLT